MNDHDTDCEQVLHELKDLREKARQFDTLVNNLNGMVYRCRNDHEWSMEYISNGALKLTGYEPADIIWNRKISYNDIIHPDDRDMVWSVIQEKIAQGELFTVTYRIIDANSIQKWVWEQGCAVRNKAGDIEAVEGFITDITDFIKTRKRLEDIQGILDASPAVIFLWGNSPGWPVHLVSDNVLNLLGYTSEELMNGAISFVDIVYPADIERISKEIEELSQNTDLVWYEQQYRVITKSGEVKWVEDKTSAIRDDDGDIVKYQGIVLDVSDRKRAEEESRKHSELFRSLVDASPLAIVMLSIEGEVLTWNNAAERILGWKMDEAVGLKLPLSHHGHNEEEFSEFLDTIQSGTSFSGREITRHRRDGSPIDLSLSAAPVYDKDGNVESIMTVLEDISGRKVAEAAIRESEERYRSLFENNYAIMLIIDPDNGDIVDANPAACQYYGWDRTTLTSMRIDMINTMPLPEIKQVMGKVCHKKQNIFEFKHRIADGSVRDVAVVSGPITMGGKTLLYSIVNDITDRKRAEEQIRLNESRLQSIFEITQYSETDIDSIKSFALGRGVLLTGSQMGCICAIDKATGHIHPCVQSESVNSDVVMFDPANVFDPNDAGVWGIVMSQGSPIVINDLDSSHQFWKFLTDSAKSVRTFMAVPIKTGDGIDGIVTVAGKQDGYTQTDVLQLSLLIDATWKIIGERISERRLAKSRKRYSQLFNTMMNGFALFDLVSDEAGEPVDFRCVEVNPAFERITAQRAVDSVGKYIREILPAIKPDELESCFHAAVTGEPISLENRNEARNQYFKVSAYRPEPNKFAMIFEDVTSRKLAEIERERMETRLRQSQKMEAIGRLAGGVAHDFNNMLNVILGNAEMVLSLLEPDDPMSEDIREIKSAAERSAGLTRQLLAFSRKQIVEPMTLDLNNVITEQMQLLSRLIGEEIIINFHPRDKLWNIKLDPSQIDQILANLAVNARDAIGGVGTISIETDNVFLDESYSQGQMYVTPGEYVMLSFSDTGKGMDRDIIEQIFEPFFTTKSGIGTGLGLATIYGIVRQNAGIINVYSEPEMGTTFKIYLPRDIGGHRREIKDHGTTSLNGTETILVVEDEDQILTLIGKVLNRFGYTMLSAHSPEDACTLAKEHRKEIDMLLTDVVMPSMNGRELQAYVEKHIPGVRTLFMSGYTANVIVHRGVVEEGVNFIHKPFSMKSLAEKIRDVLDKK